ncbi:hypothetical protein FKM82_028110 [Ascaphus truei]
MTALTSCTTRRLSGFCTTLLQALKVSTRNTRMTFCA